MHGIVRQSDGYVSVQSEVGKGTRMRMYFPRHEEDASAAAGSAPAPAPQPEPTPEATAPAGEAGAPSPRSLVLVDDEHAVRRLTERAFAQRDWTVLSAASAEEALDLLDRRMAGEPTFSPSLLISDMVMPGMDGAKLVAAVRDRFPQLPAILVSGYSEEMLREDLLAPGVAFLPKPFALRALLDKADELANAHQESHKESGAAAGNALA